MDSLFFFSNFNLVMLKIYTYCIIVSVFLFACSTTKKHTEKTSGTEVNKGKYKKQQTSITIETGSVDPKEVIVLAESLVGIPYQWGSADPSKGLDCSGFISYVLKNFGLKVPRISEQYTNLGKEVTLKESRAGDIILFTGSNTSSEKVGHMGIITGWDKGQVWFLHSASGGKKGVMLSTMSSYFRDRFVKVNRIFF
jgi:cell wall-associated NlpC family hydrolase